MTTNSLKKERRYAAPADSMQEEDQETPKLHPNLIRKGGKAIGKDYNDREGQLS